MPAAFFFFFFFFFFYYYYYYFSLAQAGYKITVSDLKERTFIYWFPWVYFITTMVSDFVLDKHVGHADTVAKTAVVESRMERNIFFICYIGSTLSLFYGWWWILTALGEERQKLKDRIAASATSTIAASDEQDAAAAAAAAAAAGGGAGRDGDGSGDVRYFATPSPSGSRSQLDMETVDLNGNGNSNGNDDTVGIDAATAGRASSPSLRQRSPSDSSFKTRRSTSDARASSSVGALDERLVIDNLDDDGSDGSDADVADRNDHGPDEGEDEVMPDKSKLRLLSRFGVLVQIYLLIVIVVMFVGALMFTPGSNFPNAIRVVQDIVDIIFMAGLVHTFRYEQNNLHLLQQTQTNICVCENWLIFCLQP